MGGSIEIVERPPVWVPERPSVCSLGGAAGAAAMQGARRWRVLLLDYDDATFTRSGEAAAADPRNGWAFYDLVTPWPGVDVARIIGGGPILIEGSRINHDANSRDFSTWPVSNATVTTDQADGPDGSTSEGDLVEASSATSPKITKATGLSSGAITFSVWLKKASWDGTVTLALDDGTTTVTEAHVLTDTWTRVSVTLSSAAAATTAEIRLGADTDADCYVWGSQIEAAAYPSSDIRTSGGTATRADESAAIASADVPSAMLSGDFAVDVWPEYGSGTDGAGPVIAKVYHQSNNDYLLLDNDFSSTNTRVQYRGDGGSNKSVSLTFSAGDKLTIEVDRSGGEMRVLVNDSSAGSVAVSNDWTATANDLSVGSNSVLQLVDAVISQPRPL